MDLEKSRRVEKQRAAIIQFMYWLMILGGAFLFVKYLLPVILPFVLAYLFAWMLNRPISWLSKKTHIPRSIIAAVLILLCATVGTGILALVGTWVVGWVQRGAAVVPDLFSKGILPGLEYFFHWLEHFAENIAPVVTESLSRSMDDVFKVMSDGIVSLCGTAISWVGGLLTAVPSFLMRTLITIIATIFISADFTRIHSILQKLVPHKIREAFQKSGGFFGKTLFKCLLSYLLIFLMTFTELWIGFSILRIPQAATIAILVSVLDILPVLGTGTVLIPWALISLLQHNFPMAIGLGLLYLTITVVRNMVEPKLVGKQIRLHPVLTFAGMLIGLHFFGFLGMFGIPILLAFLRYLYDNGVIHFPQMEKEE